ncbi:MAG: S8 family serine peptidase [Ketobacteraceae bacterium]|nr:S8 family serine peptidase [Ketobacteraceae bacterium]
MHRLQKLSFGTLGISIALSASMAAQAGIAPVTDRIIVKYKSEPATLAPVAKRALRASVLQFAAEKAGMELKPLHTLRDGAQVVSLGAEKSMDSVYAAIDKLSADPAVEYAEPDLLMLPKAIPNDPRFGEQWHYYEADGGMNLPNAWDYAEGDGAVVAVLDTGYRPHRDLAANLLPGYDFVSDAFMGNDGDGRDNDARDAGDAVTAGECGNGFPEQDMGSSWHGTHVAGTIAAVSNNGIGVAGVAPKAKIVPVRVLGKCGGYVSDISDAIMWSAGYSVDGVPDNANPANVINMSLGSGIPASCTMTYANAIQSARNNGVTVVVAAGNENTNADSYPPANCAGVLAVAAVNRNGGRAYYSNYGSVVDVAAPGGAQFSANDSNGILSTSNSGFSGPGSDNYLFYQGTSMATPHVAGLAALLYGADGSLTPDEVEETIKATARSFPASCNGCGVGIADAASAVAVTLGIDLPADATDLELKLIGKTGKYQKIDDTQGAIRYHAVVTNLGDNDAGNVTLASQFPEDVDLVSALPTQGSCSGDGVVCNLGDLAVGESATVEFEFVAAARFSNTKMNFTGSLSSDLVDTISSNNFVLKRFGGALGQMLLLLGLVALMRAARKRW